MEKSKDLQNVLSKIYKANEEKHEVITTGITSLDYILGGGIELGSKIQFVAESSTGKSTIALQISKNFCEQELNVLYIDTENSITNELLKSTGCFKYYTQEDDGIGRFLLIKESDFNTVSNYLDIFIKQKYFNLIIIDSLASMINNCYVDIDSSKKEVKEITNNNTNYESRPLNLFINKYSCLANKYNVAILYVNQYRNKVHPVNGTILKEFGNKIVRYNSDIILKIKKEQETSEQNDGKRIKGIWQDENNMFSNDVTLNKNLPPTHSKLLLTLEKSNKKLTNTSVETYIKYGFGIDPILDEILNDIRTKNIQKSGKYYSLAGESKKYEGFINLVNHIVANNNY